MAHVQFKCKKKIASQQTKFYALEDRKKACGLIFTPMIIGISDNIKLKKKKSSEVGQESRSWNLISGNARHA